MKGIICMLLSVLLFCLLILCAAELPALPPCLRGRARGGA